MKVISVICVLGAALLTSDVLAGDLFKKLNREKYGVAVRRSLNVHDYAGVSELLGKDPKTLRVLVTTEALTPDGDLYGIAEALSEGLKQTFKAADFKVFGRVNNSDLAKRIEANYDVVFIVGTNALSRNYEYDETVYGSRTSDVRCSKSPFTSDIDCRETGRSRAPVGTRSSERTIFTDIFFVNYGAKACAAWDAEVVVPQLAVCSPIGHMAVTMIYGQTDASWCGNNAKAQAKLARLTGGAIVSTRPEQYRITVDPDDIGCND